MASATATPRTFMQPDQNCWCAEHANRFSVIQDGANYFPLVRHALLRARHTVFILGWDITGAVDLLPGSAADDGPTHLEELIAYIARRRPELQIYILTWDYGLLFTMERDPLTRWRFGWRMPRNVYFRFDNQTPIGGSHHQKIVVVDDQLAFSGSMDLTGHRWDTAAHRPDEPARITPEGATYGPYHEVQAMGDGPLAAKLGELARLRWRTVSSAPVPDVHPSGEDLWPAEIAADFTDVDVAVARTMPGLMPPVRECESLYLDAIAQARKTIYIENQYVTNMKLADALAIRLAEPDGPEVVIITPKGGEGWLEKQTIEVLRNEVFRRLRAADAHDRLRLVFPMASRSRDISTFIHAKVMIVDDEFVRIGSANATQRSMGVDTECDLAVHASGDAKRCATIRAIRNRLLAEHIDLEADAVDAEIARTGSLRAWVDAHQTDDRALVKFGPVPEPEVTDAVRLVVDPDEPIAAATLIERLNAQVDSVSRSLPRRSWVGPLVGIAGAVAVAFLWSRARGPRRERRATGPACRRRGRAVLG